MSTKRLTIEIAQQVAVEKGGRCLSTKYKNAHTPLLWQCKILHEWEAPLYSVKNIGSWCPDCAGTKVLSIEVAQKIAAEKGGRCLSTKYKNAHTPLLWQCNIFHEWLATLNHVKNEGTWCPKCADTTLSIEVAQQIAEEKGGRCLSTKYENAHTPLLWQCNIFHEWFSSLRSVKNNGSWCPKCNQSKGEKKITSLLTRSFNQEYSAVHINPLLSGKIRYDFYIPSTKWLIEFDGIQHFEENTFFDKATSLPERQQSDRIKTTAAIEAGYPILRIHYDDIKIIDKIIGITNYILPSPSIYVSREEVYNYLNVPTLLCPMIVQQPRLKLIIIDK